tara:strand:+ start:187 stop:438 length:252 start_codon:yes stop_codon:yes gene_type:complete
MDLGSEISVGISESEQAHAQRASAATKSTLWSGKIHRDLRRECLNTNCICKYCIPTTNKQFNLAAYDGKLSKGVDKVCGTPAL